MYSYDKMINDENPSIYASGLIEKGIRDAHKLRAAALNNAFTRFRTTITGRG